MKPHCIFVGRIQMSLPVKGLTLRDYFALEILGTLLAIPTKENSMVEAEAFAESAYEMADAMLKTREGV